MVLQSSEHVQKLKNVNSLTGIQKAIEYEALRQAKLIEAGGKVDQETRTWDDAQGITLGMRKKDAENDYRYFPEPDLVPIVITDEKIEEERRAYQNYKMLKLHALYLNTACLVKMQRSLQ